MDVQPAAGSPVQGVGSGMPHENPWFLITKNELVMIEEGLYLLEREVPSKGSPHVGTIAGILGRVRERQQ